MKRVLFAVSLVFAVSAYQAVSCAEEEYGGELSAAVEPDVTVYEGFYQDMPMDEESMGATYEPRDEVVEEEIVDMPEEVEE